MYFIIHFSEHFIVQIIINFIVDKVLVHISLEIFHLIVVTFFFSAFASPLLFIQSYGNVKYRDLEERNLITDYDFHDRSFSLEFSAECIKLNACRLRRGC